MDRRDLLKTFLAIPAVEKLAQINRDSIDNTTKLGHRHTPDLKAPNDWKITWYGWHQLPAQHAFFGYWLARRDFPDGNVQVYSAVPGGVGRIYPGQIMNIAVYPDEGQILITPDSTTAEAMEQQEKALTRLIAHLQELDKHLVQLPGANPSANAFQT